MFQIKRMKGNKDRSPVELFLNDGVDNEEVEMRDVTHIITGVMILDHFYSSHYFKNRDQLYMSPRQEH